MNNIAVNSEAYDFICEERWEKLKFNFEGWLGKLLEEGACFDIEDTLEGAYVDIKKSLELSWLSISMIIIKDSITDPNRHRLF